MEVHVVGSFRTFVIFGIRFLALILFGFTSPAHAYTTLTCEETWYAPAKGHEFTGSVKSWTKVKQQSCRKHSVKLLKPAGQTHDDYGGVSGADESGAFAMVDGSAYYVRFLEVRQGPHCGGGGVVGFNPQCFLPRGVRHNEIHQYREYYEVTPGHELHLLATDKGKLCGGWYATDDRSIFQISHAFDDEQGNFPYTPVEVKGADVASFKCFVPEGDDSKVAHAWALDQHQIFFFGRPVKAMSPQHPVRLFHDKLATVDDLVVNGEKVFTIRFDAVKLMPGIGPDLTILSSSFFTDKKNIFGRDFNKINGVSPKNFNVALPVCPVPGHPKLNCVDYKSVYPRADGGVGIGDGMVILRAEDSGYRKMLIRDLRPKNAIVFLLEGISSVGGVSPFMIVNGRLYNIDALRKGILKDGTLIHGQLMSIPSGSGCVLNGDHGSGLDKYILDDAGGIDLDKLAHVGRCTHRKNETNQSD
jgi:hypothetical protein